MHEESIARAVCPGSFDPVTQGHVDIIRRAAVIFDEVIVGIGANTSKGGGLFDPEERVGLMREACADLANVRVQTFRGLVVDFCREVGAQALVKGLRSGRDFDYEEPMAHLNDQLAGIETVFLASDPQWRPVSSTLVREIALLGGDVSPFVPASAVPQIVERVRLRRAERE